MRSAEQYIEQMKQQATENEAKWGVQTKDKLVLVCIEELGELAQAHLQHEDEGGDSQRIIDEAIDLGAVGFQFGVTPNLGYAISSVYTDLDETSDVASMIRRLLSIVLGLDLYIGTSMHETETARLIVMCACICLKVEAQRNADA